jgi:hypothetical protein
VRMPGGGAVVAGRADAAVLDDHGPVLAPNAIGPGRRFPREVEKVPIPVGPLGGSACGGHDRDSRRQR